MLKIALAILLVLVLNVWGNVLEEWERQEKPSPSEEVQIILAIKQANREWLEPKLRAVSYPDSKEYGNFMELDEIANHVHAQPESVQALHDTFEANGVRRDRIDFTIGKGFAVVKIPIRDAEKIFSADFYRYKNKVNDQIFTTRSLSYSLPKSLEDHIDFTCCFDKFPKAEDVVPASANKFDESYSEVTPEVINNAYNLERYTANNSQTTQAVAGFLKQYFAQEDLDRFHKRFSFSHKPIDIKIVGENKENHPGVEATLDVEYITATGHNVSTWFISTSTYSNNKQEDFMSWLVYLSNTTDAPLVHSVSYGDIEATIDKQYLTRTEDEFTKLGISGRTLLFASGDAGVGCKNGKFVPNWPASSPHVTAVGGTVNNMEVWRSSGGGFSNVFPTPDYQKDVVANYFKRGDAPSSKYYNPNGRAYPDLNAFSVNFLVEYADSVIPVGGTSCAAPTVAGIISLLNDVRLNNGMKPLGFLNPLLYQTLQGEGFIDVTMGTVESGGFECPGVKAGKGWDPATGWGSLNFKALKTLVVNWAKSQ